jgi:hypothetical protein
MQTPQAAEAKAAEGGKQQAEVKAAEVATKQKVANDAIAKKNVDKNHGNFIKFFLNLIS